MHYDACCVYNCVRVCAGAEFCAWQECEEEERQAEGRGQSSVSAQRRDAAL